MRADLLFSAYLGCRDRLVDYRLGNRGTRWPTHAKARRMLRRSLGVEPKWGTATAQIVKVFPWVARHRGPALRVVGGGS